MCIGGYPKRSKQEKYLCILAKKNSVVVVSVHRNRDIPASSSKKLVKKTTACMKHCLCLTKQILLKDSRMTLKLGLHEHHLRDWRVKQGQIYHGERAKLKQILLQCLLLSLSLINCPRRGPQNYNTTIRVLNRTGHPLIQSKSRLCLISRWPHQMATRSASSPWQTHAKIQETGAAQADTSH